MTRSFYKCKHRRFTAVQGSPESVPPLSAMLPQTAAGVAFKIVASKPALPVKKNPRFLYPALSQKTHR